VTAKAPILLVVGGPNGAGKSTFAKEFVKHQDIPYLCADEVAYELLGYDPNKRQGPTTQAETEAMTAVAAKAGRIFLQRVAAAREAGESFLIESTLSGKSFRRTFQAFKDAGYRFDLFFIYLSDPILHVERVKDRVRKGGHHIPLEDILRRYRRSLQNFQCIYRPLATTWTLICNDGNTMVNIAESDESGLRVYNHEQYEEFERRFDGKHETI